MLGRFLAFRQGAVFTGECARNDGTLGKFVKLEKWAKNGQMVQNSPPRSPPWIPCSPWSPLGKTKLKSTPVPEVLFTIFTDAAASSVAVAPTFVLFKMEEVVGMTWAWSATIAGKTEPANGGPTPCLQHFGLLWGSTLCQPWFGLLPSPTLHPHQFGLPWD